MITEWDDGKKRCDAVIANEVTYKQFADQLVKIADYYGFDGWLVNIENPVEVSWTLCLFIVEMNILESFTGLKYSLYNQ